MHEPWPKKQQEEFLKELDKLIDLFIETYPGEITREDFRNNEPFQVMKSFLQSKVGDKY